MLAFLRRRLCELSLRAKHRRAMRKIRVIEQMELPEDLKKAAIVRVMRRFEERLNRFTSDS
jgi:hypothetical protein